MKENSDSIKPEENVLSENIPESNVLSENNSETKTEQKNNIAENGENKNKAKKEMSQLIYYDFSLK